MNGHDTDGIPRTGRIKTITTFLILKRDAIARVPPFYQIP